MGGDARIHRMQLGIRAGAVDGAGIEHAVAHGETTHFGAQRLHGADRIPAEHLGLAGLGGRGARAHLGVHRVHGDGAHAHQQVVRARHGRGQIGEVLQALAGGGIEGMGVK